MHELRQPLNIIGLASGNIRARTLKKLSPEDAAYLAAKLDTIDTEIARAVELAEQLAASLAPAAFVPSSPVPADAPS